jgi:ribosomal protein L29
MSKDFKTKSDSDLQKTLKDKRQDLLNFRFDVSGSGKRNVKDAKNLKKEIAQILTELNVRAKVGDQ